MYRVRPSLSIVAGLRREQRSFCLSDPTTYDGMHLNPVDTGTLPPFPYERHWRYSGTFDSNLWIPFLGLDIIGNGYKASLIASPFASVDIRIPAAFFTDVALFSVGVPFTQLITFEQMQYRVSKPARLSEAHFTHDINVSTLLNLKVWGNVSWLGHRQKGVWNYHYTKQNVPNPPQSESQTDRNTAVFTRYLFGGGLSAEVLF